jgi:hypothetical protein
MQRDFRVGLGRVPSGATGAFSPAMFDVAVQGEEEARIPTSMAVEPQRPAAKPAKSLGSVMNA